MTNEPGSESTSEDDVRITKIGRFLRKYKIDELPNIINIFKGDISLIGPRPTFPSVIEELSEEEKGIILSVRPGIIDIASLWDSNEEERLKGSTDPHNKFLKEIYPEIVRLQIKGIKERSFWGDVKIISRTIWRIIKR
jgi:lipopolysaccharide/colanic/teichoic acid biosynthesis glycosyltransferase